MLKKILSLIILTVAVLVLGASSAMAFDLSAINPVEWLNKFAQDNAWLGLAIASIIALHTGLKALRDAIDTTPETDDNGFEKFVTIMGKAAKYLAGYRAKKNP